MSDQVTKCKRCHERDPVFCTPCLEECMAETTSSPDPAEVARRLVKECVCTTEVGNSPRLYSITWSSWTKKGLRAVLTAALKKIWEGEDD